MDGQDPSDSPDDRAPASETPTRPPTPAGESGRPAAPGAAPPIRAGHPFGPYFIIRPLGRGGMGEVYEAEQIETGRRVALKILTSPPGATTDRARFLREGRIAASISHPHSVYVFGTEEVAGIPVIAMELIVGGTLQDRVSRDGPMPPAQAVDAILQVVAGLEAAAERGILHRDIKPSNCFMDADGTVKVGDFGLSMTTSVRDETQLTMAGSFLGTPSFASPEQLRGEPLDERADIYSVGATLYYLLTGRPPFEEERMVKLLAAVLERAPENPMRLRPQIPRALARAILRCLEKGREARYSGYAALRRELLPLSSAAPRPAPLGLRFVAGAIDGAINSMFTFGYILLTTGPGWFNETLRDRMLDALPAFSLPILYYTFLEGIWGASAGKAICGLKVVGPDRGTAGIPRALLRAAVHGLLPGLPTALLAILAPWGMLPAADGRRQWVDILHSVASLAMTLGLFATVRRRNGLAGLHELISRTRVIVSPALADRQAGPPAEEGVAESAGLRRIGPYAVLKSLRRDGGEELLLAYDDGLRRWAWIRLLPAGAPSVPMVRRDLARAGRLRWLNGRRTDKEGWDAYEAPEGRALLDLMEHPSPWGAVRRWLLDLTEEVAAGAQDGSLPAAATLDQIWITPQGRARLLDFPAPREESDSVAFTAPLLDPRDHSSVQAFLNILAKTALWGCPRRSDTRPDGARATPLPLHARAFLDSLARSAFASTESLAAELRSLARNSVAVSRRTRMIHLGACAIFPVVMTVFATIGILIFQKSAERYPDVDPLRHSLDRLSWLREACPALEGSTARACEERLAMEVYIPGRFRGAISDPAVWSDIYALTMVAPEKRRMAQDLVASHPELSGEEIERAAQVLEPFLEGERQRPRGSFSPVLGFAMFLVIAAVPGVLLAAAFRGGLLLKLLGIAVVRRDGSQASRPLGFWRSLVAWSPALLTPAVLFLWPLISRTRPSLAVIATGAVALFAAGGLASLWRPDRGVQDRIAGTFLVPR